MKSAARTVVLMDGSRAVLEEAGGAQRPPPARGEREPNKTNRSVTRGGRENADGRRPVPDRRPPRSERC
ncbi:hypothetical protein GCM10009605_61100 [Nocardiopsis composta]